MRGIIPSKEIKSIKADIVPDPLLILAADYRVLFAIRGNGDVEFPAEKDIAETVAAFERALHSNIDKQRLLTSLKRDRET